MTPEQQQSIRGYIDRHHPEQVAFLAEGYPAQRVLDDRTSFP